MKIEIWARGHAECAPDSEYDDERHLRSAVASGDDAEVREMLSDITDTERSDIGLVHYIVVSDGGQAAWRGWLDASLDRQPAPPEAAPPESVPGDGGVAAVVRPSEVLVAALGPAVSAGRAAEIGQSLHEQRGVPVIVVTDVAAVKTWPRDVSDDRDRLRAALSSLTDRAEASRAITEDEADEYRKLCGSDL